MEPSPIEAATVSLVLSHISRLVAPLPPHLISRPLLQRHHFLAVSIDTPAEYLAWPSHDSQEAVTLLLESAPLEHLHDLRLTVRYSADAESLQAHVAPITTDTASDPAFRLIFLFDPTNGWQYHNIALMPFPRDSYPAIPDAVAAFRSPNDFLAEPTYAVTVATPDDDGDDAYWNSYGRDPDDVSHDPSAIKAQTDLNTEDAYWARYSSVHGTADSTIPSPLPVKRNADGTQVAQSERVFIPSSSLRPDNEDDDEPYNPLQPPSPDALSRRLARLAVRPESPPFEDENSSEDSDALPSPDRTLPEAEIDQSPLRESPPAPDHVSSAEAQQEAVIDKPQRSTEEQADSDAALQQSIQGLYRLWRLQQNSPQNADKDSFLTLVRRAIELPS